MSLKRRMDAAYQKGYAHGRDGQRPRDSVPGKYEQMAYNQGHAEGLRAFRTFVERVEQATQAPGELR